MDLNKGFERIGNQIVAMKYIYQGYSIIDQSISFDPIDDVLDYYLYNKYSNRYIFIKIISIVNEVTWVTEIHQKWKKVILEGRNGLQISDKCNM